MKPSEMDTLSNSRWQNHEERPNKTINSSYMSERVIAYVVREGVSELELERN